MKKFMIVSFFVLTACTTTQLPVSESTSTPFPTIPPRVLPTATIEIVIPTSVPISDASPTAETVNEHVSTVDARPQVYIPAGTFRMGGMDVRRAPHEIPDHDVTLDAFWMDQLAVTNAMYALCVNAGG